MLAEKASFLVTDQNKGPGSNLLIIASQEDIAHPLSGVQYSEAMMSGFKTVDFSQAFVVMHEVGQIRDNGKITAVVRSGDTIHIRLDRYLVGPGGNYILKGFSMPYQVTAIEKGSEKWDRDIKFIIETEEGDILGQTQYYIP